MNKKESRIAIIGCGALTRIFYIPTLKKLNKIPYVLVDPNVNGIGDMVKESGAKTVSPSIEEITGAIDAAIVATPNYLHMPQAKYFLDKSKHVLLEKPMAATEREGRELIDSAQQSGAILQIGMMRRFWKINKALKKIMEEELLGKLQSVTMEEGGVLSWPVQSTAIFDPMQSLGGVLMDTGSHTLDLLQWWVQDEDYLLQYNDDNHGGVEADCSLGIDFNKTGVKARVNLSRIRRMPDVFFLKGTKGWIKLKPYGNVFESSDRRIEKYIYEQYPVEELKQQAFLDLFTEQVQSWLSAIEQGTKPEIDAESVLPSIRMIEQSYKLRRQMEYAWN